MKIMNSREKNHDGQFKMIRRQRGANNNKK